jgi:hypothetical protein
MALLKTLLPILLWRRRALLIADHSRDDLAGSRRGGFVLVGQRRRTGAGQRARLPFCTIFC